MKNLTLKEMNDYCKNKLEPMAYELAEGMTVEIKRHLTMAETSTFIDRVVNNSFSEDGEFMPEYFDFMFRATLIQMMTNIPVPKTKGDDTMDIEKMAEWMECLPSDLWAAIYECNYNGSLYGLCVRKKDWKIQEGRTFAGQIEKIMKVVLEVGKLENPEEMASLLTGVAKDALSK